MPKPARRHRRTGLSRNRSALQPTPTLVLQLGERQRVDTGREDEHHADRVSANTPPDSTSTTAATAYTTLATITAMPARETDGSAASASTASP